MYNHGLYDYANQNANEVHIANRSLSKMDCSESEAKSGENVEATSSVRLSDYA